MALVLIGVRLLPSHRHWAILALASLILFQMDRSKVLYKENIFQQDLEEDLYLKRPEKEFTISSFLKEMLKERQVRGLQ